MTHDDFIDRLAREGFQEVLTVRREAGGFLDTHAHPFEAKALVLEGELSIRTADAERRYRVGEVFHLPAQMPHAERYGPQGVSYLVGRK
jgi:quercetin dioxygenase-like cupin family protein